MNIDLRYKYFSRPRYIRYTYATDLDLKRAQRLYNANIVLAQAFHPLITQFEVILRNSLERVLAIHFSDDDWIINQKNKFMSDPSLSNSGYFLKNSITVSEQKLSRRGFSIVNSRLITDQTLGFWTSFFLSHHYSLLQGCPIQTFPFKPSEENRTTIHVRLEKIKRFRNRINHCEPICFHNSHIDCSKTEDIYETLFDLISWLDPNIVSFFKKIDNVQDKIRSINKI